jgi:hypothetical protein
VVVPHPRVGPHALLTRPPVSGKPKPTFSCDLHVLSLPPAFVLSQDQTLMLIQRFVLNETPNIRIPVISQSLLRRAPHQSHLKRPTENPPLGSHVNSNLRDAQTDKLKITSRSVPNTAPPRRPRIPSLLIYNVKQLRDRPGLGPVQYPSYSGYRSSADQSAQEPSQFPNIASPPSFRNGANASAVHFLLNAEQPVCNFRRCAKTR